MKVRRFQHRTDTQSRLLKVAIGAAKDAGTARARLGKPKQHPQRRRLPSTIRAKETRDRPWRKRKRERIDRKQRAKPLRQRIRNHRRLGRNDRPG
jgi:hypothetical protein